MDNTNRLLNDVEETDKGGTSRDMTTVLTIAGSDCPAAPESGGLKDHDSAGGVWDECDHRFDGPEYHGSLRGIRGDTGICRQQLDSVFQDIFPDAVKIGMVSNLISSG